MGRIERFLLALLAAGAGCHVPPEEGPLAIRVTPRDAAPLADGHGLSDVVVTYGEATALFERPIVVSVSSGTVNFFAEAEAERRTFRAKAGAAGRLAVALQHGRSPGRLRVEARVLDHVVSDDSLELAPRLPDALALVVDPPVVDANGRDAIAVRAALEAIAGQVSVGAKVRFRACCEARGRPSECPRAAPPLRIAPAAVLGAEMGAIEVTATAERIARTATAAMELGAWIVASAAGTPAKCAEAGSPLEGASRVTLRPVD